MNGRRLRIALTILFFVVVFVAVITPSAQADRKGRKYFEERGEVVWEVSTDQKVTALTFDDGPDPKYTPQILELLKQYHAKATFFVVGSRVEQYPDLAKQEVLEGHEVANHTYSHPELPRITAQKLDAEITQADEAIQSVIGKKTLVFRPPGGYYSELIVNTAKQSGHMVVMWSWNQDSRDWQRPGVHKIVKRVLSNAHNGGIVLFHDHGADRKQTVAALQEILPELEKMGYRFVTVSELLKISQVQKLHRAQ